MKKDIRNRIIGIGAIAAACSILIISGSLLRDKKTGITGSKATGFSMGSVVTVTFYGEQKDAEEAAAEALEMIRILDEKLISWRITDSELSRWNNEAAVGEEVSADEMLCEAVRKGILLHEKSGGALDLTIRPVLDLWGIEDKTPEEFSVPSAEELAEAKKKCGMDAIKVTDDRISRSREVKLDLGAVGKGYALDMVYDQMNIGSAAGIVSGGVLAVGGSVLVCGSKPDGSEFRIGIRDPEGLPDDILGYVTFPSGIRKMCISTSGGYEKYIEKNGIRYHHIIDPDTLYPADSGLKSVTVVCEDGLVSDGLSTACFILGEEKAVKLLSGFDAEGIFIREDGSIFCTPGIEGQVVLEK